MKGLSKWARWVGGWLYIALNLVMPILYVVQADDPLRTAIALAVSTLAVSAIAAALFAFFWFFQKRLSARAYRTLNVTLGAAALFILILVWRMTARYSDEGGAWSALVNLFRSENPLRELITLSAAPVLVYLATGAVAGVIYLAEQTLRGDALWTARVGIGALIAFAIVVVFPAGLLHQTGEPVLGSELLLSLMLWLGMVVPAIGVLIAYRRIGDGRS